MTEAETMLATMLKLDWNKMEELFNPICSYLYLLDKAVPQMESHCRKGYYDEATELCKQIYAGTMSVEQAAAYWREVVVSTKDEWYASVQRHKHKEYIEDRVPVLYREPINPTLLPNPNAYQQVMNWMAPEIEATYSVNPVPIKNLKGLICIGKSGMGKTRSVYARLIELNFKHRFKFIALSAVKLVDNIRTNAMISQDEVNNYLKDLIITNTLFIDDINQIHLTPTVSRYLLQLFEQRAVYGKPILLTSQLAGDDLIARYVSKYPELQTTAEAIVRRIRDFCTTIDFDHL